MKIFSDFNYKCAIFNDFFAKQCTLNVTSSGIPPINMLTNSRLPLIATSEAKVPDIIFKINSKKAHGYDDISIAMLKNQSKQSVRLVSMVEFSSPYMER